MSEVPIFLNNGKNAFLPVWNGFGHDLELMAGELFNGNKMTRQIQWSNLPYSRCDTNLPLGLDYVNRVTKYRCRGTHQIPTQPVPNNHLVFLISPFSFNRFFFILTVFS